jgi:hypothetical protein
LGWFFCFVLLSLVSWNVCGALIGSVMAVGIKYRSNDTGEEKKRQACALYQQFEKQKGTVLCRKLIKYDLSKPEQI